jgi:uncharacterized delta-60 repeat protein
MKKEPDNAPGPTITAVTNHADTSLVFSEVGTSRCDVPARAVAGGTVHGKLATKGGMVAPLNAARTARRTVPTSLNESIALIRFFVWFCLALWPVLAAAETADDLFVDVKDLRLSSMATLPEGWQSQRLVRLDSNVSPRLRQLGNRAGFHLMDERVATIVVEKVEIPRAEQPNRFVSIGTLAEFPGSRVILAVNGAAVAGRVSFPFGTAFVVEPIGEGLLRMGELSATNSLRCPTGDFGNAVPAAGNWQADSNFPPADQAGTGPAVFPRALAKASVASTGSETNAPIDLLVLYTESARRGAGGLDGVDALIDFAMTETAMVYANSGIRARINVVGRAFANYLESGSVATDLNAIVGFSSAARSAYKADLVIMMIEREDQGFAGAANGIPPVNGNSSTAFAVFRRPNIISGVLVVHELGHLLGCAHDRQTSPSSPLAFSYSRGHRFVADGVTYIDIMSYQPGINIPYFSNPDVLFRGVPTGVPEGQTGEADNAKTINLMAARIAAYQRATNRFEFGAAQFGAVKNATNAVIRVVRTGDINTSASVAIAASNGTATNGVDFIAGAGTVTFASGQATQLISVRLLNNTRAGGNRTVLLDLIQPQTGSGLGYQSSAILNIVDPEARFEFGASTVAVWEGGPSVALTVRRIGDANDTVTVELVARDLTAKLGEDYRVSPVSLVFAPGETEKQFLVEPMGDTLSELDETFELALRWAGSEVLSPQGATALVTVRDQNRPGALDRGFMLTAAPDQRVLDILRRPDGRLICGGRFGRVGNLEISGVVQFNPDGSVDTKFGPVRVLVGPDPSAGFAYGAVGTLGLQLDGKLIVGGLFAAVNGVPRNNLARLNADGSLDLTFDPKAGANGAVGCLALQSDGQLLVGGSFTTFNGEAHAMLARLRSDGSLDASYAPQIGLSGFSINAIALESDGRALIGGYFQTVNGLARTNLARLETDGRLDATMSASVNGVVSRLALLPDGRFYVSGRFTAPRSRVARFSAAGLLDGAFQAPALDFEALDIMALPDSRLILAGAFTTIGAVERNHIAYLQADGSVDATFDSGVGPSDFVYKVVPDPAGGLYLAGSFLTVSGQPSPRVARLRTAAILPQMQPLRLLESGGLTLPVAALRGTEHILEVSSDLRTWTPVTTNRFDQSAGWFTRPARTSTEFYRVRLGR